MHQVLESEDIKKALLEEFGLVAFNIANGSEKRWLLQEEWDGIQKQSLWPMWILTCEPT